jgi:hypothetical protein
MYPTQTAKPQEFKTAVLAGYAALIAPAKMSELTALYPVFEPASTDIPMYDVYPNYETAMITIELENGREFMAESDGYGYKLHNAILAAFSGRDTQALQELICIFPLSVKAAHTRHYGALRDEPFNYSRVDWLAVLCGLMPDEIMISDLVAW